MSAVLPTPHTGHHDHAHDDHHHHAPTGWRRWVFATNHKDIGTLYLLFSFTMLMVGGVLALMIRAELFQPGLQVVNPELFNQLTTMHGLIMVFGAIMPAFVGFANWMIPLQIGASDMAFARMNNFSFWLLIPAGIMLVGSFFMPGGAPAAGWTLYAPLTLQMGMSMDTSIFAMHIMGASSIMGAINIIVTILNMRAPGLTLMKMSMFCWTWLITAYLLIAVMPVLAGAITMTLTDRHFGTSFFNPAGGGDRHRQPGGAGLRAQAAVRLRVDGVRHLGHCHPELHRVGAPHVHHRHAGHGPAVLHVRDHADRGADGREDLQLDRHHVAWLDVV